MKSIRRKLLSLLLAMAMVLTLVPTALAEEYSGALTVTATKNGDKGISVSAVTADGYTVTQGAEYSWTCTNSSADVSSQKGASFNLSDLPDGSYSFSASVSGTNSDGTEGTLKGGPSTAVTISTTPAPVTPTTLSLSSVTGSPLTAGGTAKATVTATVTGANSAPVADATVSVSATTGDSATAVVGNSGKTNAQGQVVITVSADATKTGTTTFEVSCGNLDKKTFSVLVNAATASVTAAITPTNGTVNVNGTLTMTVTPTPSTAEYDFVEWNVTNGTGSATINKSSIKNQAVLFGTAAGTVSVSAVLKKGTAASSTTVATASAVTVTVGSGNRATLRGTPANTSAIYLDNWMNSTGTGYEGFTVTPYVDNVLVTPTNPTYTWSVNGTPVSNYYYNSFNLTSYNASLHYGNTANTVSCKATFTWNNQTFTTDEYTWTVYTGYNNYLASVNVTNSYTYALGNRDDNNGSSIVDQLSSRYYNAGYYTPSSVQFLSTTHTYGTLNANTTTTYSLSSANANYLGNVVFTPSNSAGKAVFSVRVYFSNSATPLDGTICFDTSGATVTSGDINYSGALGDTVYFDASDFADFYYSKTSGGSLNYVTFSTVSSGTGTLYCNGSRLSSAAYYSATSTQNALDGVYFTPSGTTASRGGTVRIGFTASGTRYGYGYNGTISGTVVINYLNGAAKDITYTPTGSSINLSASDFTAAYREVMGSTAPNDLTIQFQDVPDNGTLTYKSSSTATPVTLRATNVKSYRFSTNGSSSNQIANVTYTVSGTRSDTVEYIAYTGGVARFTGKVIFNPSSVSTSVIVTLTCPSSTGGAFNLAEFTKANAVVMANTFQVRFLMPTRGTLTYGGMTATAAGLTVPVNMINSVFYKPNAGMNGIDTVGFVCLDASGNQVGTGQVNVVVSGNTSTSTNTGVTSISQFTDVPANAWYATVLADLVSRGIVQGTGNGKAEPRGTLNYGQALKMILLAAGYPAQAELNSGTQWAANYKSLAVSNGLIDSSVDLTAPISRDAVVELIAKALKVSPVSGNSPFKDSNNPYAIALNRTNPAIIIGNEDGTFNGSSTLLRQEVWAIVYRMNQYTSTQYSTQVPDGI